MIDLEVQYAQSTVGDGVEPPCDKNIQACVVAALAGFRQEAELVVRVVDIKEIQELNRTYRHKDSPTNVLSFPFEAPEGLDLPILGDIVICHEVVVNEASEQAKSVAAHWAHMVVHGVLHLLGFDHVDDTEAEEMEALEVKILAGLAYANPYQINETN